jgi:S-adenosylhomocysteine hydrolase
MILDDGGDATLLVHKGVEFEKAGAVPDPDTADSEEFEVVLGSCPHLDEDAQLWHRTAEAIKGVTEETTTGVHRLYQMQEAARCCSRRSTSTTRSPSRSSTTSTAAATRSSTASTGPPTS